MSGPVQPPLTVETIDGATVGRPITKIKVTNGTLAVSGSTATLTISGGGGSGTVTSVGLTETGSALTITGSPVTTSGTINIAGAGTSSQVILGDLSLGTLTSGTVTGTGAANQVSYWTSSSAQAGSTGLTYNPSTGDLTVGGYVEVGTKVTTPSGTDLTLDTVGGTNSGSIVIADGVDGQVSISANGAGPIKLGAANNPVTVSNVYTLPTAVTTDNGYVLTAQTDGSTAWAASGGGGGIGGSITDNQVAVGATTADEIEGSTSLTFDGTMLKFGSGSATAKLSSNGAQDLVLTTNTNAGFTEPYIQLNDTSSGNISINSGNSGATKINIGRDTTRWVQINNDYYLPQSDGSSNQFIKTNGSGTLSFSDVTLTFPLEADSGSLSAPSYSFSGDTNTGMYSSSADNVNIVTGGSIRATFNSNGITIGDNTNVGKLSSLGANNLQLETNNGTNSGSITVNSGVNGNIDLLPNGAGQVNLGNFKFDVDQTVGSGQDNYVLTYDHANTQISLEAASGGGGGSETKAILPSVGNASSTEQYSWAHKEFPFGSSSSALTTQSISTDQPLCVPFIARRSDTLVEVTTYVSTAAGSVTNMKIGVYTDNNGQPQTLLGVGSVDVSSTGQKTATLTAESGQSLTTVAGSQYWVGFVRSASVSFTLGATDKDKIPSFVWRTQYNANYGVVSMTGSNNQLPSTFAFTTGFSWNVPAVGVRW